MKITFMGAGSTVFARNVIGDCMCSEALRDGNAESSSAAVAETQYEEDDGRACANGGKRIHSEPVAHYGRIYEIIGLLKDASEKQRPCKRNNVSEGTSLGHILDHLYYQL